MIIPIEQLPAETLTGIIDEYILRENVSLSDDDTSHEVKVSQVKKQLQQGSAVIVYSELHETVNILSSEQFKTGIEE